MVETPFGIIGLGALGRALAALAGGAGTRVVAWSRSEASRQTEHPRPGLAPLGAHVEIVDQPSQVVEQARTVFFALPCYAVTEIVDQVGKAARGDHYWIHGTKGLGDRGELVHEIIRARTCVHQIAVIGGPVAAQELDARGSAGLVVASRFDCVVDTFARHLFSNGRRLHRTRDLIGVEVAAALRNVINLAAGMAADMGESVRSAVLARGLTETARFGVALGAETDTFVGLAGAGDLISRRDVASSRDFEVGLRCARGEDPREIQEGLDAPVEGASTARAALARAAGLGVDLPLTRGVQRVLSEEIGARPMIEELLTTDPGLGAGDRLV